MSGKMNWGKRAKIKHEANVITHDAAYHHGVPKRKSVSPLVFQRSVLTGMSSNVPVGGGYNRNRGGHGKPKTAKAVQLPDPFEEAQRKTKGETV